MRRLLLLLCGILLSMPGCARRIPTEVTDLNRDFKSAKDACASVYAADELRALQSAVDSMNELADAKKYSKARKEAEPLMAQVEALKAEAERAQEQARREAQTAIDRAGEAVDAARAAEAEEYDASGFRSAQAKLGDARRQFRDPCKYPEAERLAEEAARLADGSRQAAVAEKKRLEEEARRRAEEEEARRRALEEERRRRAKPPTYTVEQGDCLWFIAELEKVYSEPLNWPLIFEGNQDKIRNPDLIFPGQEFKIPRGMSEEEMRRKVQDFYRRYVREREKGN